MVMVWAAFIIELLIYFIFKPFIGNEEIFAIIIIIFNIPFVFLMIGKYKKNVFLNLFLAFFIRMIFMFLDIYGSNLITLPHSGTDTEGFLSSGVKISNNITLLTEQIYGGAYSKILGVLFFLGPTHRIIGQYINVLLGLTTILLVWRILTKLKVKPKMKNISLILMSFFPSAIIFSSILLREALISFLVVFSFYIFLKWFNTDKKSYFAYAITILLLGATLHTGVIGIVVGYIFMFLFYSHTKKRLVYSIKSSIGFILLIIITLLMSVIPLENIAFLDKFTKNMEDIDDLYNIASGSGRGGSSYLKSLSIDNPLEIILFGPIKMIYFLLSPVPWDWRGLNDIISFFYDGLFYLILCLYPILTLKTNVKRDPLIIGIFVMLVTTVFIFGVGVTNAGTAMRHRYKLFHMFIILFFIIKNKRVLLGKTTKLTR